MNDQFQLSPAEMAWHRLPEEMDAELRHILDYWAHYAVDHQQGGFYGQISHENQVNPDAPRGSVLYSRILWSFSAGYNHTLDPRYLEQASRAYRYIRKYLTDHVHGGLYWTVDRAGNMLDGHKQVYAQAFGIYAMSEYYRATADPEALQQALEWYGLIEKYSRDPVRGGYTEAFSRDWAFLENKRLSAKDENAPKTMNTHLHIIEAYANLYTVAPDEKLKSDIAELLVLFDTKIIDKPGYHLGLFFTNDWQMDASVISYGHDIEAGWLLQACAISIGEEKAINLAKKNALHITDAAMEGLDETGGLNYEYNLKTGIRIAEKHWWPQAEALIGFCNAWQLTKNDLYKTALLKCWDFIQNHIIDKNRGEWYWGMDATGNMMPGQDKAGIWKCPYHNSRACLELIRRLRKVNSE